MPNLVDVAKAVKHRSTFPLSFQHGTTMDFGKTAVIHSKELMPGDKLDIDVDVMCQLAPLVVPTMGSVNLYLRGFFAPYRFVWKHWESFFMRKDHPDGSLKFCNHVPVLNTNTIWSLISNPDKDYSTRVEAPTQYDYAIGNVLYKLTYKGRAVVSLLLGLGYPFSVGDSNHSEDFSFLPLLSLVKVFRDYYVNPNYDYTNIDAILDADMLTDNSSSYWECDTETFEKCIEFVMFGWFESDIFTSAWASPEDIGYSQKYSNKKYTTIIDYYNNSGEVYTGENDVYQGNNTSYGWNATFLDPTSGVISQVGLNLLKSVRNMVLRRSVSGARYIDQLLSRFGIRLNNNEARRSVFIGTYEVPTQISRIDATSAGEATFPDGGTLRTALGDYTGRGFMKTEGNSGHFSYENNNNDFGHLLFIAHLFPRTAYYQGAKPENNHIHFEDFFNPDLEDIGNAPIPQNVVFDDYISPGQRNNNGVFGYAPNYFEYKSQLDYLTGDFRFKSVNSQLKSFQLMRELKDPEGDPDTQGVPAVLGEEFQKADQMSMRQFNRMFLTQTDDADHFITSFWFNVTATRNCNSLGNSLVAELNEHGNDVGDLIKVRPNGKYF